MPTLREWLDTAGFDWEHGMIIYQENHPDSIFPHDDVSTYFKEDGSRKRPVKGRILDHGETDVLDREFDDRHGHVKGPIILARDRDAIYFVSEYDGSCMLNSISLDQRIYLGKRANPLPVPGGG